MAIISIFRVTTEEEDNICAIFSEYEFVSGMEKLKKVEEGTFLLIHTEAKKYRAQVKVDVLLEKYFTNASTRRSHPPSTRNKKYLVHNNLLTYTATLSKPLLPKLMINIYTTLNYNSKDHTISFAATSNTSYIATYPPFLLPQRQKTITEHNSVITQTTTGSTKMILT